MLFNGLKNFVADSCKKSGEPLLVAKDDVLWVRDSEHFLSILNVAEDPLAPVGTRDYAQLVLVVSSFLNTASLIMALSYSVISSCPESFLNDQELFSSVINELSRKIIRP